MSRLLPPACGYAALTLHCGPGAGAEKARSTLGDTVCPPRPAPGTGMPDRTAPRESRALARWAGRVNGHQGRWVQAGQGKRTGQWAGHWPLEPVAKVASVSSDRAGPSASVLELETRVSVCLLACLTPALPLPASQGSSAAHCPLQVSMQRVGCHQLPTNGQAPNILEGRDMVWCDGEDAATPLAFLGSAVWGPAPQARGPADTTHEQPSFPRVSSAHMQGCRGPQFCSCTFLKESTHLLLSGPLEPSRREGEEPPPRVGQAWGQGGGHSLRPPTEMGLPGS